jgi:hypothetical protein
MYTKKNGRYGCGMSVKASVIAHLIWMARWSEGAEVSVTTTLRDQARRQAASDSFHILI